MPIQDLFDSITQRLGSSGSVRNVYGEPITVGERTIIPVAKIGYGFGGGAKPAPGQPSGEGAVREEGGGGGGVGAKPVGVVEIAPQGTRFIPFNDTRRLGITALAGFGIGLLFAWRMWAR